MESNGTINDISNLEAIEEDEDKDPKRKLSTMVTASMAVKKLQNDQKRIQEFKKNITIMRRDSQKIDLHTLSEKGDYENVKNLLEKKFDANDRNELYKTPLHLACKSLSPKVIELLLENGADVDAQDSTRMTALHHLLLISGRLTDKIEKVTECMHLLIKNKADVNVSDHAGCTPLHLAAMRAEESWVDTLIEGGADMSAKNNEGVSVLYFIMKHCPNSLTKCLDNCVKFVDKKGTSTQTMGHEARIDFNTLDLRKHTRRNDEINNRKRQMRSYENTTDPTVFFCQVLGIKRHNDPGLNKIIENVFLHPVSQTYFHIKWSEIRWLYYLLILLTHFVYSAVYSTYAVLVYRTICCPLREEVPQDVLYQVEKNSTCT